MYNWCAVVDNVVQLQWGLYKPNSIYYPLTIDQLITDYGLFLPINVESLNVLNFLSGDGAIPTQVPVDIVSGLLITGKGKVYHVISTPDGTPVFRLVPTGQGSHFITSEQWVAEESVNVIVSYTRDSDEIIAASEKVLTTNPGLRFHIPLEDLAAQIEQRRPSLPISSLFNKSEA